MLKFGNPNDKLKTNLKINTPALNYNLIVGAHGFTTKDKTPYQEFSLGLNNIGWGKYRFLRIDYVRSYQSGFINDGVLFGISL